MLLEDQGEVFQLGSSVILSSLTSLPSGGKPEIKEMNYLVTSYIHCFPVLHYHRELGLSGSEFSQKIGMIRYKRLRVNKNE